MWQQWQESSGLTKGLLIGGAVAFVGGSVAAAYFVLKRQQRKKTSGYIIIGAPASGKGTQCEKIVSTTGVVHLSTGDMLRAEVKNGTALGREAQEYMKDGKLVPDKLIVGMIKAKLEEEKIQDKGFLLDGFPRTKQQAEELLAAGIQLKAVFVLQVQDENIIERVAGRRVDPQTGASYHIKFNPPPNKEIADRLEQRADDNEESMRTRLEQFHQHQEAVVPVFPKELVIEVDGNGAIQQVWDQIKKHL